MILRPDGDNSILIDAVLAARDFYKLVGPPPPDLPVPIEDFLLPMSRVYVSRSLGEDMHEIHVEGISHPSHLFRSMLVRKKGQSTILVHHSLNVCFTRFAVAIELSSLLMADDPSLQTNDIVQHLTGLLAGLSPQRGTALYGEVLAEQLAIELLMPMQHRAAMETMMAADVSPLEIATAFRVPQYVIDWSLAGGWSERVKLHDEIKDPPQIPPPGAASVE